MQGNRTTILDVLRFLLGQPDAIRKVAATRWMTLVAFVFIVSAALARNYDFHLLHKEPIWIVGPLVMPLITSCFVWLFVSAYCSGNRLLSRDFIGYFRCFLMTAPIAWVYGLPVEEWMSPLDAAQANFGLLLFVSLWRVTLMVLVIWTLFRPPWLAAVFAILLPASLEMGVANFLTSFGYSMSAGMGGLRLSPEEAFLASSSQFVTRASLTIFMLCLVGTAVFAVFPSGKKGGGFEEPRRRLSLGVPVLALLAVLAWGALATQVQPRLNLRAEVQSLAEARDFEGLETLFADRERGDFPANQRVIGKYARTYLDVKMDLLERGKIPDWLREEIEAERPYPLHQDIH